jgi:alkanesulfonate monooxygenase SsuD/methylene tetrahydromethanopterin reductase-like flavin-dependent oxidoreductase (luciferase family)
LNQFRQIEGDTMQYGFVFPRGDARSIAELSYEAEQAGWDGVFVWEPVWGIDAWVALTAAAMRTQRVRLGTLLSPLSRMRPWKLASETATLDNLSQGRVILSVGLGAIDTGFAEFGEVTARKVRAELLDEGLEILTGLWRGQPFEYHGKHYQVQPTAFYPPPPPVQQPRIPIWVVGAWPRPKSMARALKYDGLLPAKMEAGQFVDFTPADLSEMKAHVEARRQAQTPFDIVVEGTTPGENPDQGCEIVAKWAEAGATWWIEALWETPEEERVRTRLLQGPPRLQGR